MIPLPQIGPDEGVLRQLGEWQALVQSEPGHPEQVARAQREWDLKNRKGNTTFDQIKVLLDQMCCGGRRCMYCEDSLAHEIEHGWPKSLYPGLVFAWLNFLYACGACNRSKDSQFAVFVEGEGAPHLVELRRQPGPPTPPPPGMPVIIDPRSEDPLRFLRLDLNRTFRLLPTPGLPERERARADYTRRVLPLNGDALVKQRKAACGHYRARLGEYVQCRDRGESATRLRRLREALLRLDHPTVWREMQRQHRKIPFLQAVFAAAPEALTW